MARSFKTTDTLLQMVTLLTLLILPTILTLITLLTSASLYAVPSAERLSKLERETFCLDSAVDKRIECGQPEDHIVLVAAT